MGADEEGVIGRTHLYQIGQGVIMSEELSIAKKALAEKDAEIERLRKWKDMMNRVTQKSDCSTCPVNNFCPEGSQCGEAVDRYITQKAGEK